MQRPSPHPKPGGCLCPFQVDFTWGSRALQLPLRRHASRFRRKRWDGPAVHLLTASCDPLLKSSKLKINSDPTPNMWKPLLTAPRIPCHFAAPSKGSAPLPCMSLRAHIDWVALEGHAPNRRSRSRKSFGNGGRTPTFRFRPIIYIYIYIHRNSVFIMDEWKTEKNAWKRISTRTCICFLGKQNTYH